MKTTFFCFLQYMLVISLCLFGHGVVADDTFVDKSKWELSGYLKLNIQAANKAATKVEIDDLSLFLSANINRWVNPFIEAEIYNVPIWVSGQGVQLNSAKLTIERLYNDLQITETDTVRLGKFLSPISRWNIIHAAPLVWTTNRPVTTRYSFSQYISGIKYRHEFDFFTGNSVEFFWQPYREFLYKPTAVQLRQYQNVAGVSWIFQDDLDTFLSLNFQHGNVKDSDETRSTLSFNGFIQKSEFELESEVLATLVDTNNSKANGYDWGGYLQLAVPLPLDLNIITRYEHFEFANKSTASDSALLGLVYRPYSKLSLKLEWQQTWGSIQKNATGLYSSIAVMF